MAVSQGSNILASDLNAWVTKINDILNTTVANQGTANTITAVTNPLKNTGGSAQASDMNTLYSKMEQLRADEYFGDSVLFNNGVYANGTYTYYTVAAGDLIQVSPKGATLTNSLNYLSTVIKCRNKYTNSNVDKSCGTHSSGTCGSGTCSQTAQSSGNHGSGKESSGKQSSGKQSSGTEGNTYKSLTNNQGLKSNGSKSSGTKNNTVCKHYQNNTCSSGNKSNGNKSNGNKSNVAQSNGTKSNGNESNGTNNNVAKSSGKHASGSTRDVKNNYAP